MVTVILGSIETTNAIFLKERLTSAAYEGARSAITPGQTATVATAAATAVLTQFKISGGSVTITPTVGTATTTGTTVTVSVSAPFSSNSVMQPFIIGKTIGNVTAVVTMDHQ
jgi:Flp pilus assembly protein TadG